MYLAEEFEEAFSSSDEQVCRKLQHILGTIQFGTGSLPTVPLRESVSVLSIYLVVADCGFIPHVAAGHAGYATVYGRCAVIACGGTSPATTSSIPVLISHGAMGCMLEDMQCRISLSGSSPSSTPRTRQRCGFCAQHSL